MRKLKKAVGMALIIAIAAGSLTACGKGNGSENKNGSGTSGKADTTETGGNSETDSTADFSYPMDGSVTLKWWLSANTSGTGEQQDRKNNPIMGYLSEATGVNFEFIMPPIGEEKNAFNIMCASNDMPDIIMYDPNSYSGGLQQAIDDGVVLKLNDYLDTYCPNLVSRYLSDPVIDRKMQTYNGDYGFFPCFSFSDLGNCWCGWQIRKDWLDEQGMELPETMDEWYTAMKTLMDVYDCEYGMTIRSNLWGQCEMATAYQTSLDYDIKDSGEIVYGPATPEFKEFLTEMHKWYAEGLLHPDFATMDDATAKANYAAGKSVGMIDSVGAQIGIMNAGRQTDPDFLTIGTKYPVLVKGDTPYRGYRNIDEVSRNMFISGDISEDKLETALRFLDYGYSEEGQLVYNLGKEGITWKMDGNEPVYTDMIMNNPDGLDRVTAIRLYTLAAGGPMEQHATYSEANMSLDTQKESCLRWAETDQAKHAYSGLITGTPEQEQQLSLLNTNLTTYADEMRIKFIMGTESLDHFDQYVAQLYNLGLQEALDLKTSIYNDYMKDVK